MAGVGFGQKASTLYELDGPALRRFIVDALSPTFPEVESRLTGVACKVWSADGLTYVGGCKHRCYGDDKLRLPHDLVHFAGTETEAFHGHVDGALAAADRCVAELAGVLDRPPSAAP